MRQEVSIRQDGPRVIVAFKGKELLMSAASARQIAHGLLFQAGKAEEIEQRERAVFDQAILYRTGAPMGLLHDVSLDRQAMTEAAWNSKLRRYIPASVKAKGRLGVPTIISHPPTPIKQE
jgi:hypothetical protein